MLLCTYIKISPYLHCYFFFSCTTRTRRSLFTIPMWSKQSVSECEWTSSMLMPAHLHRQSPGCRPECVVSSECPQNRACVNQKCVDPCPGTCGLNARCEVINHSPICSCQAGYTGDPFTRCFPIPSKYEFTSVYYNKQN
jgi:hypothetical protein